MNKKKDKETKKRNETHIIKNEEKCKVNVRERVSVREERITNNAKE